MHQIKIQVFGIFAYVLGSQVLTMMPFLQLYPALMCSTGDGTYEACDQEVACLDETTSYIIDWSKSESLKNWMTENDYICLNPA